MNIYARGTNQNALLLPRLKIIIAMLVAWLGLEDSTRLPWSARLPCVLIASLLLVLLISGIGVPTKDIYFVLILPFLGIAAILFLKRNN